MSEWGLATTISDLQAVLGLVPAAGRKVARGLIGHSLGASIVEEYAAWDFTGRPGYEDLAGLVLIDGTTGAEGNATPPIRWPSTRTASAAAFPAPAWSKIRSRDRFYTLPLLGSEIT